MLHEGRKLVKETATDNADNNGYKGAWTFEQLERQRPGVLSQPTPHVDIDDPVAILFTSGTTGLPKGALLSHHSMINASYMGNYYGGVEDVDCSACVPLPAFHIFGLNVGVTAPLTDAHKTVVFPHFFPDTLAIMRSIEQERCTSLKGPPTFFFDIINHARRSEFDLRSLKYALLGASIIPKTLLLEMKRELALEHIILAYGMSETTAVGTATATSDIHDEARAYESIGRAAPFTEVKIVDPATNRILPVNTDGICACVSVLINF